MKNVHNSDRLSVKEKRRLSRLRGSLLAWWKTNGESYPWRKQGASAYERICVEVLLQRTRRETVSSIYDAFFTRFPSWGKLATCTEDELAEFLQPLGLWRRRATSLRALARYAAEHDGHFPSSEDELAKVPAVGQYVGNAILLFQHGKPRPLVDVNTARVLERVIKPRQLADIRHDPWLQAAAYWFVRSSAIESNWAMLDFAGKVCRSRNPLCEHCPVSKACSYFKESLA